MNTLKTTFLMALLTVLLVTAGGMLGGEGGMIMAFLFALVMNGVSYWFSDKIVCACMGLERSDQKMLRTFSGLSKTWRYVRKCPCPGSM